MKKLVGTLLTTTLLCMSSSVFASATHNIQPGWYLGIDAMFSDYDSEWGEPDLDVGFGFNFGYEFVVSPRFTTGLEFEFAMLGSEQVGDGVFGSSGGGYVVADIEENLSAINVNLRPKYFVYENLYVGAILGFGSISYDLEATKSGYKPLTISDDSDMAINYGIEVGYFFNNGLILKGGVRKMSPSFDINIEGTDFGSVDFDITSTFVGLGWQF